MNENALSSLKKTIATTNEIKLVERLVNKDQHAFAALYINYSAALLGIILRIVKDYEEAEDILQETFVKISKNFNSYEARKGRLYTWMATLARNSALDYTRSRRKINSDKNKDLDELLDEIELTYSIFNNVDTIGLRQLTTQLTASQKQIIDLIYFKGYTQVEVADELTMPVGTIKTRVRQAINCLRKSFELVEYSKTG